MATTVLAAAVGLVGVLSPIATSSADTTTTTEPSSTTTTLGCIGFPLDSLVVDPSTVVPGQTVALSAHYLIVADPTHELCSLPYTGPVTLQLVAGAEVTPGAPTFTLSAPDAAAGYVDGQVVIPAGVPSGPATLLLDFPGNLVGSAYRESIVVAAAPVAPPATPTAPKTQPALTG